MQLEHAVWGRSEWGALLRGALVSPQHDAPAALSERMSRLYGVPVLAINAARNALSLVLGCLARRDPSRCLVLLPAYVCPAVIEAVRRAGLSPVFAAVGPDLNLDVAACAQALARHRVLAVVAAHMYGCPAKIGELAALCEAAGVALIDDAAHAPGIAQDGRLLGAHGVAGLVSFSQSKTITTGVRGAGAVLIVNDPSLLPELAEAIGRLPGARARRAAMAHFISDYLVPWPALRAASRMAARMAARLAPGGAASGQDWYRPARIGPFEAAVALAQLARLDDIITARKRVIGWYAARLPRGMLVQYAPGRYLSRLMVRVADPAIALRLGRHGIATRPGYSAVAGHLLELPLRVTMCARDVERVCDIFSQVQRA